MHAPTGSIQPSATSDRSVVSIAETAHFLAAVNALEEAEALFESVNRRLPEDPTGLLGKCDVAIARGNFRSAVRFAEHAMRTPNIDRHTMATAFLFRADALFGLGRRPEALKNWNKAIAIAPDSPGALVANNRVEEWRCLESQSVCFRPDDESGETR